jgi:hypothetical protein
MLKEAHTISYIQQASHEWIEGDEKEIAYAQAIESLRVVPTDIQHGPKVLQRFKAAHKPLVKALSSFENMESHGELINNTRNSVICNHHVCNWDATAGHMQLCKVFYATAMDFCPLFGYVCNYGATMITFIPTLG